MKRIAWIALGFCVSVSTQAASFDCSKAATRVEKMICDDDKLSRLDEEMSVAYKSALKDVKHADIIKQAQKQWIKERNDFVEAVYVKQSYERQLLLLKQPIVTTLAGKLISERNNNTATLLPNGKVLIVGGWQGDYKYLKSAELYDTDTGHFSITGSLVSHSRGSHFATLLLNGKVLIAGGEAPYEGHDPIGPIESAELYDPVSGSFSKTGTFIPFKNVQHHIGLTGSSTATLLKDGKVLFAKLLISEGSTTEIFDPETGYFVVTGSFLKERIAHTSTLLKNGLVLITGGRNNLLEILSSSELYDSVTGKFKESGSLSNPRFGHTSTLMLNGKVLVVGGQFHDTYLASAEIFDPDTGNFSNTGSLVNARTGHTATLLKNGKVLIAGGVGNDGKLSSMEIYEPGTGAFSLIGRFIDGNQMHIPVMLKDGKILFVGNSTAELYDPANSY